MDSGFSEYHVKRFVHGLGPVVVHSFVRSLARGMKRGAAAATVGSASIAGASPGGSHCGGDCGYSTARLEKVPTPTQLVGETFYPSMAQLPASSHVLPVINASGVPIHHP